MVGAGLDFFSPLLAGSFEGAFLLAAAGGAGAEGAGLPAVRALRLGAAVPSAILNAFAWM